MREFDAAIIGAGAAGLTVAAGLSGFGKKVALVERQHVGGDCTNVGCIPSKLLIHLSRELPEGSSSSDALARVRKRRDRLRDEENTWVEGIAGVSLLRGEAVFVDPHTLEVARPGGEVERIRARRLVVATGSSPALIPIDGLPPGRTLTNEGLFDLEELPDHLAIVGAGAIGCEMAFAFRRLGSEITLIDLAPRVLPILEPDASELIRRRLEAAGVRVLMDARTRRYHECSLLLEVEEKHVEVEGVDRVLLAVGRRPNLDGLGLEAAGVRVEPQGVPTNAWGRTSVPHIYAVGDVTLTSAHTHSANAQGRRLVQKLALPPVPIGREPVYPSAIFTDPEVAQVGPTLEELERRYHPGLITTVRIDLADTDRGFTLELEDGFLLLHAVRLSGRLLSATIVAPHASEMISLLTLAVNRRLTLYALSNLVFPYPVLSEAIKKAASSFVFETLPRLPRELGVFLRHRWARPGS